MQHEPNVICQEGVVHVLRMISPHEIVKVIGDGKMYVRHPEITIF